MSEHPHNLARRLRRRSTQAERVLWGRLLGRQLSGRKWRRQYPVDQYVADFLCPEVRLIVEIDGDVHVLHDGDDRTRQAHLEAQGFQVVRFTNEDILTNLDGVLEVLWRLTKPNVQG